MNQTSSSWMNLLLLTDFLTVLLGHMRFLLTNIYFYALDVDSTGGEDGLGIGDRASV